MSIKIKAPCELNFEELEYDDHIPSLKFSFLIKVNQFSSMLTYKGEMWINCSDFDHFVEKLNASCFDAEFKNMDETFLFKIEKNRDRLALSLTRQSVSGEIVNINYVSNLTEENFLQIKDEFNNYPKWW